MSKRWDKTTLVVFILLGLFVCGLLLTSTNTNPDKPAVETHAGNP